MHLWPNTQVNQSASFEETAGSYACGLGVKTARQVFMWKQLQWRLLNIDAVTSLKKRVYFTERGAENGTEGIFADRKDALSWPASATGSNDPDSLEVGHDGECDTWMVCPIIRQIPF